MPTFYEKIKLLKGLLNGGVAYTAPFYVNVNTTNRCNLKCLSCPFHSPLLAESPQDNGEFANDIPYSLFEKLCNELVTMGKTQIILSGQGEPFLHPRIFDLITVAKSTGLQVMLFTNGILLNEDNIRFLIDCRLDILKVSLWAKTPEEYEKNYPGAGPANFEKIVEGLKLMSLLKTRKSSKLPIVNLCHPINSHNYHNIGALVDLVYKSGCNSLHMSPVIISNEKLQAYTLSTDEKESLYSSLKIAKKQLHALSLGHNIDQTILRYKIGKNTMKKLPCYVGWYHTTIGIDGEVYTCCRCKMSMGNLKEKSFREIWNGSAYRTFRKNVVTQEGLASMNEHCDCGYCPSVGDNLRIHKLFKWISPFCKERR